MFLNNISSFGMDLKSYKSIIFPLEQQKETALDFIEDRKSLELTAPVMKTSH